MKKQYGTYIYNSLKASVFGKTVVWHKGFVFQKNKNWG